METITYQEIMVIFDSRFFSRQLLDIEEPVDDCQLTIKEQLADACWNGLLKEVLPELTSMLIMQQINEGNQFLNVCLGEHEDPCYGLSSLNPYFFLNSIRKN